MPNTKTITPPSFDDFTGSEQALTQTQDISLNGTNIIQDYIFDSMWAEFFTLSLIISLIIAIAIIYAMLRIRQIRKAESQYYAQQPVSGLGQKTFGSDDLNMHRGETYMIRWKSVIEHVNSDNSNDWRQAILEADVLLDTAITSRGYTGDGIGEKMKQINRSDINSIDHAWEAHKVRNRVAHEGSNFELTQREAKRVIGLYEKVFVELKHIS